MTISKPTDTAPGNTLVIILCSDYHYPSLYTAPFVAAQRLADQTVSLQASSPVMPEPC